MINIVKTVYFFSTLCFASLYAEDSRVFDLETIGKVSLICEKTEEIRSSPTGNAQIPAGVFFISGKYYVDTYKIISSEQKIIWQKEISYPELLKKDRSSESDVYSVNYLDNKLFVLYSNNTNVWIDELDIKNDGSWGVIHSNKVMAFGPISKTEVIKISEGYQIKIYFQKAEPYLYNYSNGKVQVTQQ